jgi:MFS transporter, SP family, xylose:H+ symportor
MNSSDTNVTYIALVCLVAALGGLLFGYDTGVISGAIDPLEIRFELSPQMKGWTASCALVGCIAGASLAGVASDRWGRKKVLIVSAILFLVSALGTALPRTLLQFVVFRFIGGLGVGAASFTSPLYIAEIAPARMRGRLVSVNQFAIVTGFLVVYFVNYFISLGREEAWIVTQGWRWMFGSEALPAVLLLVLMCVVPESPRWLTKQGRGQEAQAILTRVEGSAYAQVEMQAIRDTLSREKMSLSQVLSPGIKGVLGIGIALAVLQQVTGINVFLYYAPVIFKKLGSTTDTALLQTVIVGSVNLLFTVVAIWTVDKLGRRPLMMIGSAGMGICLATLGSSAYYNVTSTWVLIFMLGYIASFALSVGPVTWVILSEIFPTQIRGRAMGIATFFLWTANFVVSQTFPMMDENAYLVERFNHGFPFWIYGAFCVVLFWVVWCYVPETKGQSLEEIEKMWMKDRG